MAEKSCRPAFSLPFHGLSGTRQVDFSNEVPDQFNLLPAVAAGLIRRMDDDLLYKLIDDGGRQFPDAHIFSHNGCKAGKIGLILFKGFYCVPPCLDLLRQFFLFCLIDSLRFSAWAISRVYFLASFSASWKRCFLATFSNANRSL